MACEALHHRRVDAVAGRYREKRVTQVIPTSGLSASRLLGGRGAGDGCKPSVAVTRPCVAAAAPVGRSRARGSGGVPTGAAAAPARRLRAPGHLPPRSARRRGAAQSLVASAWRHQWPAWGQISLHAASRMPLDRERGGTASSGSAEGACASAHNASGLTVSGGAAAWRLQVERVDDGCKPARRRRMREAHNAGG